MEIIKNKLRHYGEIRAEKDTIDESLSVIVPDTQPDALQIIGADPSLYIQENSCAQGTLKIAGTVNCNVCYYAAEGREPYSVTASIPFSFSKETGLAQDDKVITTVSVTGISASMVNPRKFSVKVQIQVFQRIFKHQVQEYAEDMVSGEDEQVHCLREKIPMSLICDIAEKKMVLNDEIRLSDENLNDHCTILRKSVSWDNEDVKVLPGKVMIKGRADTSVTALDEQGEFIGTSHYSVPFSQIIECESLSPDDRVEIFYCPVREDIEIFTHSEQISTMTFAFAAITQCVINHTDEISAVKDAFSTKWNTECPKTEITMPSTAPSCRVTAPVKEIMPIEGTASKVLDISARCEHSVIKKGDDTAAGSCCITVIYKEKDGSVLTCSKRFFAEAPCESTFSEDGLCLVECANITSSISPEGEITVSFDLIMTCRKGKSSPCILLSDCVLDKTALKQPAANASLIVKSAEQKDTVWNIAKAYNTSPAVIASANKIDERSDIAAGQLILIPFVCR